MDAAAWDERYAGDGLVWHAEPNRFVAEEVADLPPGRALDLACGEGRNTVWLAERGWRVEGVDFSVAGLAKAERLAAERGVEVALRSADLLAWTPPSGSFDLVVVAYLQLPTGPRAQVLRGAAAALAPGGVLLVVAHDARNLAEGVGGPQDPSVLYGPEAVLDDLADAVADGLEVQRADTVERPVEVDGEPRIALDSLVRLRRPPG